MTMIATHELEDRIRENERKIRDMDGFVDDPKINKIIRVLKQQIARDSLHLTQLEDPASKNYVAR